MILRLGHGNNKTVSAYFSYNVNRGELIFYYHEEYSENCKGKGVVGDQTALLKHSFPSSESVADVMDCVAAPMVPHRLNPR